jgi:flagellar biosynthesis protein FlhF
MARALARRIEGAPVLIDMPGTSPFDPSQNEEMAALANVADARIAVVLPAGLDGTEARETAEAFAGQSGEYLVTTRLDVARRLGCVLAAGSAGLALAEAGIGPGAADGLVQMTADLLARRLLEVPKQWERRQ